MRKFPKQPTLLIRAFDDPELFEGIMAECDLFGWRVVNLIFADGYIASHDPPIGAIFARLPQDDTLSNLRKAGVPVVNIWSAQDDPAEFDACVAEDRVAAGRLATDVLVEREFSNLGYITHDDDPMKNDLFAGLFEQVKFHNANISVCRVRSKAPTQDERYNEQLTLMADWLKEQPMPIALLALNYRWAIRIIAACEMADLSVPEQVAIICRGGTAYHCRTAPVPLSSIDGNRHEVGRASVRAVKRLVDGEGPLPETILVPPKGFIERRSTDILAVSDPRVAKAVRFMWDHLNWPIQVDDVAFEVGTSRNTLERGFQRCLNRGVHAELRRKRMEVCKDLLRGTKMNSAEIAKAIGLGSRRHLHRAFKDAFGMTPKEYRNSLRPSSDE